MSRPQDVPILRRAISVLDLLASRGSLTAKALAMELGLPASTCYRILGTLADARWLRRDELGAYHVSIGLAMLGSLAPKVNLVVAQLGEPLRDLATRTRLTAKATLREGAEWVMIARHEHPRDVLVSQRPGARGPISSGSVGIALLSLETDSDITGILRVERAAGAFAARPASSVIPSVRLCRTRGYAVDAAQTHPAIHAVSIPLEGRVLGTTGALTVFGLPHELPAKVPKDVLAALRAAQAEITHRLTSAGAMNAPEQTAAPGKRRPAKTAGKPIRANPSWG